MQRKQRHRDLQAEDPGLSKQERATGDMAGLGDKTALGRDWRKPPPESRSALPQAPAGHWPWTSVSLKHLTAEPSLFPITISDLAEGIHGMLSGCCNKPKLRGIASLLDLRVQNDETRQKWNLILGDKYKFWHLRIISYPQTPTLPNKNSTAVLPLLIIECAKCRVWVEFQACCCMLGGNLPCGASPKESNQDDKGSPKDVSMQKHRNALCSLNKGS